MKAAWYERQGPARDVLIVGEMPDPQPLAGEVRIRVTASGVNPGDVKKRQDAFGVGMPYARVIPHSDGAGTIDRAGEGVSASRVGERVWCWCRAGPGRSAPAPWHWRSWPAHASSQPFARRAMRPRRRGQGPARSFG